MLPRSSQLLSRHQKPFHSANGFRCSLSGNNNFESQFQMDLDELSIPSRFSFDIHELPTQQESSNSHSLRHLSEYKELVTPGDSLKHPIVLMDMVQTEDDLLRSEGWYTSAQNVYPVAMVAGFAFLCRKCNQSNTPTVDRTYCVKCSKLPAVECFGGCCTDFKHPATDLVHDTFVFAPERMVACGRDPTPLGRDTAWHSWVPLCLECASWFIGETEEDWKEVEDYEYEHKIKNQLK